MIIRHRRPRCCDLGQIPALTPTCRAAHRGHPPNHVPKYQKPTVAAIAITTATAYGIQSWRISSGMRPL